MTYFPAVSWRCLYAAQAQRYANEVMQDGVPHSPVSTPEIEMRSAGQRCCAGAVIAPSLQYSSVYRNDDVMFPEVEVFFQCMRIIASVFAISPTCAQLCGETNRFVSIQALLTVENDARRRTDCHFEEYD